MEDLAFATAREQAELVRQKEVSSADLVNLYLDRIERLDGQINSYVHVLADRARDEATRKDEETASGGEELPAFHGVPVSIKELNFLAGAPTTLSTSAMEDFVAPFDDEVVARLQRAGMVPLGKTNAPELGTLPYTESQMFGACRNPWDQAHTPGGSSGGAAAALAAGLCPVSQGSDGGGSLRIPAGCTGVFALKPSRDRVSNAPMFGDFGFGLITHGMLTRTVADGAALLDVISGYVPGDPGRLPEPPRPFADEVGRNPGRLRIGVLEHNPVGSLVPEVNAAVASARQLLDELGHDTVSIDLEVPDNVVATFEEVWAAMAASRPVPVDSLEPFNRWLAQRGEQRSASDYLSDQVSLQHFCRRLVARFHDEFDVMAAPVANRLPLKVGEFDDLPPEQTWEEIKDYLGISPLVNASGQPAAAVPLHWDEATGLPVGVQFIGRLAEESLLIRLCAQLEEARPWVDRRPPGFE